jgi:NADPH:quinone reductase-like Zn-dependent oxidoreductase
MLITESYRQQNAELHKSPKYGRQGAKWSFHVVDLAKRYDCKNILDYGCGKGLLKKSIEYWDVREYDPAIPGKELAERSDLVICTDVLEHIEPDLLDNVLKHLSNMTGKILFVCIATKLAKNHILPDGRNPHLSLHDANWWQAKLEEYFNIMSWNSEKNACYGEMTPILEIGKITSIPAMDDVRRNENVKRNCKRILKRVRDGVQPHNLTAHIVCFGPSLATSWPALVNQQDVYCVGAAHDFLISKGIVPYASIDCDPRARIVDQITPHESVRYWLASCVDPSYIQKLRGHHVELFHLHNGANSADYIWSIEPDAWVLVGGGSVGLRLISLLYARGYRKFSIHGMDSSYEVNLEYAGPHVDQKPKPTIRVRPEGSKRWFKTNPSLVDYARQFLDDLRLWEGSSFKKLPGIILQEMVKCSKSL